MSDNNNKKPQKILNDKQILLKIAESFAARFKSGESCFQVKEICETIQIHPRQVVLAIQKSAFQSDEIIPNPQDTSSVIVTSYFFSSRINAFNKQESEVSAHEKQAILNDLAEKKARLDWVDAQKSQPKSFSDAIKASDMLSGMAAGAYMGGEKRDYPTERNQTEKCGAKPAENHRPRTRPKNEPALVITHLIPATILFNGIDYPIKLPDFFGRKNRGTGNRCGHDPEKPLEFKPMNPSGKGLPAPCFNAIKKLTKAYADIKKFMPLLNSAGYYQKAHAGKKGRKVESDRDKKRRLRKLKKCGAHVQMRSERRESIFIVLCVMLSTLDVKTMRVGRPLPSGKFQGISMESIAKRGRISLSRAERAMTDLTRIGYVKVFQRHDEKLKKSGIYKGLPAVRTISIRLFGSLKLDEMLSASRKGASKLGFKLTQAMEDLNALALQEQADFINERRYEDKGLPLYELRKVKAQLIA